MLIKRFLIIALTGIILSFSLLVFLVVSSETALLEKAAEEKAAVYASSVVTALRSSMDEGKPMIARKIVADLNNKQDMKVSFYKADGSFAFGAGGIDIPQEIFSNRRQIMQKQGNELLFLTPLLSEPECKQCHVEHGILGITAIKMPLNSVTSYSEKTGKHLLFFGIILVSSAAIAVSIIAKKMMIDPIVRIHQGLTIIENGDLGHRIAVDRNDELGALAEGFNQMTEHVQKAHIHLETAVRQKTKDLSIIAELSTEVFKGTLPMDTIIYQFLNAMTDKMGYSYASLCLIDRETGLLSREYKKGLKAGFCASEISLAGDHPLVRTIRDARPSVGKNGDMDLSGEFMNVAVIPVLSHQRKRCKDLNLCLFEDCPAFDSEDERCWLISNTKCKSPQSLAGNSKIFGCLHCPAFPVIGVLIAGREDDITKSSLHSLEILVAEIAAAIENQRLIQKNRDDIASLMTLQNISVERIQQLSMPVLTGAISSSVTEFGKTAAAIIWLRKGDALFFESLSGKVSFETAKSLIPEQLPTDDSFVGRSVSEGDIVESVRPEDAACLEDFMRQYNFRYLASVPLKFKNTTYGCITLFKTGDFLMTDSEKAVISLFASHAAAAINTAILYAELEKSEYYYRTLSENLPGIVYRVFLREGNRMQFFNDMVRQITGFTSDELKRGEICSMEPLIMPEDRERVINSIQYAIESDQPFQVEYRIRSRSGEIRYCSERGRPMRGTDYIPSFIDGVIFDITESKRAEGEMTSLLSSLKTEKEFSEAIFNYAASGILVVDTDGKVLKINPVGAEILRVDAFEVVGSRLTDLYPETSEMLCLGEKPNREFTISFGNGESIPVGYTSSVLLNALGGENGIIILFRNLEEIKKLQAELRKKEHFETMGKVISGVAHEVRNPLFGISSIGQILEREIDSDQHKALLQAMLKETGRLNRLIEELLLYTRPSRLDIKDIDLSALFDELNYFAKASKGGVEVQISIPPLLTIRADRDKISQVFLNLINNALDAARSLIRISASKKADLVEIVFTDDGQGIKEEDVQRIFDPFFTTKKGGTGLGLPICKKIVEDHGGTVDVLSTSGNGTTLVLTLKA